MKKILFSGLLLLSFSTSALANSNSKPTEKKTTLQVNLKKILCDIFTTVVIVDSNRNVLDTKTVKTTGSGL